MKRIFVRGISRSGGTLMATVLDAHPQVAMCYEIYQHLLAPPQGVQDNASRFLAELDAAVCKGGPFGRRSPLAEIKDRDLRTFAARAVRAGSDHSILRSMLEQHTAAGYDFSTFKDRMFFIEQLAVLKMEREAKEHWGSKIASVYAELAELYPDSSYFLYMLRDGRDVAASRKKVGSFDQSIDHIARNWERQAQKFQRFSEQPGVRARFVRYERLTLDPEGELRQITDFLGLPWDDRLLSFHDQNLTIYRNATGHLSAQQVAQPINTSSVGRWQRDLTAEEVGAFEVVAGSALVDFGYERS